MLAFVVRVAQAGFSQRAPENSRNAREPANVSGGIFAWDLVDYFCEETSSLRLSGPGRKFGDVCGEEFSAQGRSERRAYLQNLSIESPPI